MRQLGIKILVGILFFWMNMALWAAVVPALYSVKMPVASYAVSERNQAINTALKTVFIRVSGNSEVIEDPAIVSVLHSANDYVKEYAYTQADQNTLLLEINFDPATINQILIKAHQSIWSKDRPLTLVWLSVKDAKGTQLIGNDSQNDLTKLLSQNAEIRGLPLLLPILDLADLQTINADAIWDHLDTAIDQASRRYFPDAILTIGIDVSHSDNIISYWQLLSGQQKMQWEVDGSTLQEVMQTGVDDVGNALVKEFAAVENNAEPSDITIVVQNLNGITDYAKVMDYLKNLSGVKSVQPMDVSATEATFSISMNTNIDSLLRAIQLDALLKLEQNTVSSLQNDQKILTYQYVGAR